MAKIIYVGMFDAVDVDLPTGGHVTCKNGEVSNLPDSLAKSLLEQKENWKEAKEKKESGK